MKPENQEADWLGWTLQFIFGFIIGAMIGVVLAIGRRRGLAMSGDVLGLFVVGTALVGGGLVSYYGDDLWFDHTLWTHPSDKIKHNNISRLASICSAILGAFLMIIAAMVRFNL
jgi:hypothetical protein